jgi:hypothetical protein
VTPATPAIGSRWKAFAGTDTVWVLESVLRDRYTLVNCRDAQDVQLVDAKWFELRGIEQKS